MKRLTMLVAAIVLIAVLTVYYNGYAAQHVKTSTKQVTTSHLSEVTDIKSSLMAQGIIDSSHNTLLIFDLYAPWCGPCRMLAPVLESLAGEYGTKASFYRVNVDELPDVAAAFGVNGIPHVVFVKNKEAIAVLTGLHQRSEYEKIITTSINSKQSKNSELVHNN